MTKKINVLIVDDSKVFQRVISSDLIKDGRFNIMGLADHPLEAFDIIKQEKPDVIILDIEMPYMNGLEFLQRLKKTEMYPTIILTSKNATGTNLSIQAMEAGALYIFEKPKSVKDFSLVLSKIKDKLVEISGVNVDIKSHSSQTITAPVSKTKINSASLSPANNQLILIGSSTGGVNALSTILPMFPASSPAILIVQHMPEGFTNGFATRMNKQCAMNVREASSGDVVAPGNIYIAPGGDKHMKVTLQGNKLSLVLKSGERVNGHCPSVDALFNSFENISKFHLLVLVMTGMGSDGALGMKLLANKTKDLFIQSESTCVIYGMPKVAYELTPSAKSVDLEDIPASILKKVAKYT